MISSKQTSTKTEWENVQLKEIAKVQTGPFGSQLHEHDYVKVGLPIITVENLVNGKIKRTIKTPLVSKEDCIRLSKYILRTGDVVFSRVGSVDRSAYCTQESDGWLFSGRVLRVRPFQKINSQFLNLYFSLEKIKNIIRNRAVGGTMPSLNTEILNSIVISVPPVEEQERIVAVLEVWDEYLEKLELKIELKIIYRKNLLKRLLNGETRFNNFKKKWQNGQFSDITKIEKGKALSKKDITAGPYPVYAGGKSSPYSHSSFTHENIITISASGANAGFIRMHRQKIWASDCSVISTIKNQSDLDYLNAFLESKQNFIYGLQSGGAQPHIYPKDIASLKISYPEIEEQIAIGKISTTLQNEINILLKKKKLIETQKKYILNNLVTGKRRTPEDLRIPTKEKTNG